VVADIRNRLSFGPTPDHLLPVAPRVGPFASRHFLDTVWRHTGQPDQVPLILADERGEAVLTEVAGRVSLLGHEDLVDYRSPVGEAIDLLVAEFRRSSAGREFRFDSLPIEAADVFAAALSQAGIDYRTAPHTTTAVLRLPDSFDEYLGMIGKKERHETRRKRRRFESSVGPVRLHRSTESGPAIEEFFRLHRMSPGSKGRFMTDRMAAMFSGLLAGEGWRLDALYGDGSKLAAAAIGYADGTGYYLYNSAFNPAFRHASPGVVLLSELIRSAIEAGLEVFDFLKGDETYKSRLGARRRALFVVEGST